MRIVSLSFALALAGCTQPTSAAEETLPPPSPSDYHVGSGVPITTQQSCPTGHACNILEILDLHTSATSEDKGFDELRARAAAAGADAVIGAEFEHGDDGGQSHLSGVLVRYATPPPPHEDLGEIDIPSNEDDQDKGMAAMSERMREMGGDQVINVTFEHGDDGAQGHLRGMVIRYNR
jgi:uncharacterized protein YbjQ (UPF0145 family)